MTLVLTGKRDDMVIVDRLVEVEGTWRLESLRPDDCNSFVVLRSTTSGRLIIIDFRWKARKANIPYSTHLRL